VTSLTHLSTCATLLACCAFAGAATQEAPAFRSYKNERCGIEFKYPVGLVAKAMTAPNMDTEFWAKHGRCAVRLVDSARRPGGGAIEIVVVNAPLAASMESDSNWTRTEEGNDALWTRQGYSMGYGTMTQSGGMSIVSTDYSLNCGKTRLPGQAMSCDALAGGVSNGTVSALVDSGLSNDPIAAGAILRSIKFMHAPK
jgi:hypothetical protein